MELIDLLRLNLEKQIDDIIKKPESYEYSAKLLLNAANLEENLEQVMSFLLGMFYSNLDTTKRFLTKSDGLKIDEINVLLPFIERRITEIKESMIKTRLLD